jgi:hypothetical protein
MPLLIALILLLLAPATWADNTAFQNTGIGVNGSAQDSNLTNVNTQVRTGNNMNQNVLQPVLLAPSQTASQGGSSALVLPRNPLNLPNAMLGRSNFGLQFGVENQPSLSSLNGGNNAMGWFVQGGLTIPFGKVPEALSNANATRFDDLRQQGIQAERRGALGAPARKTVEGRVMSAYNLSTVPAGKLPLSAAMPKTPKLVALAEADVFSKPLLSGQALGAVATGNEYAYLGHTRSGWIKILMPDGKEGWTQGAFEYLQNDYTEVDTFSLAQKP